MKKVPATKVQHADRAHSKLGASSAKRWFNCPGSVALCEEVPTPPSSYAALEGTAAHELGETILRAQEHAIKNGDSAPAASYYIGKKIGDIKVTAEMAEAVQTYVDFVRSLVNSMPGAELHIEKRFHLDHIHPACFGTSDVTIVQPFKKVIAVDYKHGVGIPVEVEENEQLLYYLLGASFGEDFESAEVVIVQPRCEHRDGPTRRWPVTPKYLANFAKILRQKALATEQKNAPLKPGEWCRFCPAAGVCPALYQTSIEAAQADFADDVPAVPTPARQLAPSQIAKVIQNKKLLIDWLDAVEELATAKLLAGEKIEGLKLVNGRNKREWKDELRAEEYLRRELGERAFKSKLLSVAQAEEALGSGTRIFNLFETVTGKPTVVPESDKRTAFVPAQHDFNDDFIVTADDF